MVAENLGVSISPDPEVGKGFLTYFLLTLSSGLPHFLLHKFISQAPTKLGTVTNQAQLFLNREFKQKQVSSTEHKFLGFYLV